MSSAYDWLRVALAASRGPKSAVKIMYRRGPRTEPWGKPNGAGTQGDFVEPWATMKERSCKKEVSHPSILPERPKETDKRCKRISWSTVSNAALTSNRAKRVT